MQCLGQESAYQEYPPRSDERFGAHGRLAPPAPEQPRMQKFTESYIVSYAKIKAALGVEEMPVDAREGLRRTIESFK